MPTYLSAGFGCVMNCGAMAPTHNNGKFKYVVIFSQTGEWGMCCEKCAEKGAENESSIDSYFYQDEDGIGYEWGEHNIPDPHDKCKELGVCFCPSKALVL